MYLKAEKLHLIEELMLVNDMDLINKIKDLLKGHTPDPYLKRMSLEDFYAKIEESEEDYRAGRVISQEELEKKIESWKKR